MSLLSRATTAAPSLPSRVVLYAGEGFGKTSFAAHAPKPLFLMTQGETGLLSLLEAGRVPAVSHIPEDFKSWRDLTATVRAVAADPHDYKTLVVDTGNGAESLCTAAVCEREFNGNWAEYTAYGRGNEQATKPWGDFLAQLDEVRTRRGMAVLILHHAKVKSFKDPAGKDWDQWRPEAVDKLWALTHKWADVIAFGGVKVSVNKQDKATGGEQRFLRTDTSAAIVAKNRYGMPAEVTAPAGAQNLWAAFAKALREAKARGQAAPQPAAGQATKPPAPRMPATGEELHRRLRERDQKLSGDKRCGLGALLSHVSQAGVKAGYGDDITRWSGPAIQFAVDTVKQFEAGLRPAPAAA